MPGRRLNLHERRSSAGPNTGPHLLGEALARCKGAPVSWSPCPFSAPCYAYDPASLRALWPALHRGDREPFPKNERLLSAWQLFHAGRFEQAVCAGLAAGMRGWAAANAAQLVHAHYLETDERAKRALLLDVVERADAEAAASPGRASAYFQAGAALGRYAQGIPLAAAQAQGLVGRIRAAFERAIAVDPCYADAYFGLGTLHAEMVDKLGPACALAVGSSIELGLGMFRHALQLNASSISGRTACATGLLMLAGSTRMAESTALFQAAAASQAHDARERLDVEIARMALQE